MTTFLQALVKRNVLNDFYAFQVSVMPLWCKATQSMVFKHRLAQPFLWDFQKSVSWVPVWIREKRFSGLYRREVGEKRKLIFPLWARISFMASSYGWACFHRNLSNGFGDLMQPWPGMQPGFRKGTDGRVSCRPGLESLWVGVGVDRGPHTEKASQYSV